MSNKQREQSIHRLRRLFNKIQFMQLGQEEFPTKDLHLLSYYAQYSIHPNFSHQNNIKRLYQKLSLKYWSQYENIDHITQARRESYNQKIDISQCDQHSASISQHNLDVNNEQQKQHHQAQSNHQSQPIQDHSQHLTTDQQTEAFLQLQSQPNSLQLKVTKTYTQIQSFLFNFNYQTVLQNQSIAPKIHLLNSWTAVPSQLPNFTHKKLNQQPKNIDSATYLQNLKLGKQYRKQSTTSLPTNTRSIILGKNESTQTKQMKHMLKIQAKTNFVQQKQKQEQKLNTLDKKSIQLNYLLNVITKQFFNDFEKDILKILRENGEDVVKIFCQKVIEKVKEEHNFIEIYVQLVKKLCKASIQQKKLQERQKFNILQVNFVSILQKSFTKLIESQVQPSTTNFNEYKYQKQIIGMSQFIGKLIKQKVLSRKIFKVCFWQIVYRYVQKVKENPEQQIVNQCLIQAIITISDSIGNAEMLKLIQKETLQQQSKHFDEVIEINKFQQMMIALVNPNDENQTKRDQEYKNLIDSIKVEEYPHTLAGLMQIFVSKRMKLKFLVENWQQKIETLKGSTLEDVTKMQQQQKQSRKQSVDIIVQKIEQDLIQYDEELKQFIKEIKHDPSINSLIKSQNNKFISKELSKYENLIKKYIQSQEGHSKREQHSRKVLKLLIIQFLKQFADCKDHYIAIKRVDYFIDFVHQLKLKDTNKLILGIICEDELENLMIIECDYPFLVEGLCHLLVDLMEKLLMTKEKILQEMKSNFSQQDEDMAQFYEKVESCLLCKMKVED